MSTFHEARDPDPRNRGRQSLSESGIVTNFEQSLAQFCFVQITDIAPIARKHLLMPFLIYTVQITRSFEELAKGLQSAGLQVKSFASGEITADECLLVMTSEAVLANLRPANVTPRAGHAAETSEEPEGVPPPSNMNAHLESQAAIWNRLRTVAKESATSREEASSSASKIDLETEGLGSIPGEIRFQRLASSPESETLQSLPVPLAALSASVVAYRRQIAS